MNRKLEKLIPDAINVVKKELAHEGKVAKEYNGYIASFGASVIQNGILAAILFYNNTNAETKKDRSKLMEAISKIIKNNNHEKNDVNLFEYASTNKAKATADILDAATALKLAIRTFELTKSGE